MSKVKRALLMASCERYLGLIVQFGLIAVISRLLTPEEIGISVVGTGIVTLASSLRDFASCDYLIQRRSLTSEDVSAVTTLVFLSSCLVTAGLVMSAPWLARYYRQEHLAVFIYVVASAGLLDALRSPIAALLQRELAFGTIALINVTSTTLSAIVTATLAVLGFSYMSIAWSWLAANVSAVVLCLFYRPPLWTWRPSLRAWRAVLGFGAYSGSTHTLHRIYENLPQLLLGRIMAPAAVGLYSRATTTCGIPEKLILSQILFVAFPAFAAASRDGRSLGQLYLRAVSFITVVHWPAMILLALLAHSVVLIVLGSSWLAVVPLVRIMCVAGLFWSPVILTHQLLITLRIRHNLLATVIARPLAALLLCGAAFFGLTALAASQLVATPLQLYVALRFLRLHIRLRWSDLARAVWKSAVVTLCSAAGPLVMIGLLGFRWNLPIWAGAAGGLLGGVFWMAGLWLTRHPALADILGVYEALPAWRARRTAASEDSNERPEPSEGNTFDACAVVENADGHTSRSLAKVN